tara:strand:- start:347 stop:541 length:195 start_codon:yes stop_codon:yes gene_type:complete
MTKGFGKDDVKVEFEIPQEQIDMLLKKYKKIKKYQKSNLYQVMTMDGTERIVSEMIEEAKEEGF